MSYYINLNFKEVMPDQTFEIISDVKEKLKTIRQQEVMKQALEKSFHPEAARFQIEEWLRASLRIRAVYWQKYNLLGIYGVDEIEGFYSASFQNSCDHDYEMSYWPPIRVFQDIIEDTCKKYSEMPLLIENENKPDADYKMRSEIYDKIFNKLDLDNLIYKQSGDFKSITIDLYDKDVEIYDLSDQILSVIKNQNN